MLHKNDPVSGKTGAQATERAAKQISINRISKKNLAVYCRQMAVLLNAGIAILPALDLLAEKSAGRQLQTMSRRAADRLKNGSSLAESFAADHVRPDRLFISFLEAGEKSGCLPETLEHLADYYEQQEAVAQKIRSAVSYPLLVCAMAFVLIYVAVTEILPSFEGILSMSGGKLPRLTQILLSFSDALPGYAAYMLMIPMILFMIIKLTQTGKKISEEVIFILPGIGSAVQAMLLARSGRIMEMLLAAGLDLSEVLYEVRTALDNSLVNEAITAAIASVQAGDGLSGPLGKCRLFTPLAGQMLAVGEETGKLEHMFGQIADYYGREADRLISRNTARLEPILMLIAGAIVGVVVIAIMLPVFSAVTVIQ